MATCVHALQKTFDQFLASAPKKFNLQPYKADKYFGLLLDEKTAEWFKNMLSEFANEVSNLGTNTSTYIGTTRGVGWAHAHTD